MSVTIEKIDLLRERTNISYSEAQEILERFDGNVVEALISLESNNKTHKRSSHSYQTSNNQQEYQQYHKKHHDHSRHKETAMKWLKKLHATTLAISKNGKNLIDLPLTIAIPAILFTLPFSIFVLIGVAITGHSLAIKRPNGINFSIDKVMDITESNQHKTENENQDKYPQQ